MTLDFFFFAGKMWYAAQGQSKLYRVTNWQWASGRSHLHRLFRSSIPFNSQSSNPNTESSASIWDVAFQRSSGEEKDFLSATRPNVGGHCACLTSRKLWPCWTSWPHPPMSSKCFVLSGHWGVTLHSIACRQVRPGSTSLLLTSLAAESE